jgi:hypothetical protein
MQTFSLQNLPKLGVLYENLATLDYVLYENPVVVRTITNPSSVNFLVATDPESLMSLVTRVSPPSKVVMYYKRKADCQFPLKPE